MSGRAFWNMTRTVDCEMLDWFRFEKEVRDSDYLSRSAPHGRRNMDTAKLLTDGAGGGGRTLMPSEGRGILSPVRLPVPPLQQVYGSFEFTAA